MQYLLVGLGIFFSLGVAGAALSRPSNVPFAAACAALALLAFAGAVFVRRKEREAEAARVRLLEIGKRARGVVTAIHDTGASLNDNPQVRLDVRVEPAGETPFTISNTMVVSRLAIPKRGDPYLVIYDEYDRSCFVLGVPEGDDVERSIAQILGSEVPPGDRST